MVKLCRRIVEVVARMDTETFKTNRFNTCTRLEQLREYPINVGQLIDATMDARGEFAFGVYDRFVNLIDSRSSDFFHTNLITRRETRLKLSAYGRAASRWRSRPTDNRK